MKPYSLFLNLSSKGFPSSPKKLTLLPFYFSVSELKNQSKSMSKMAGLVNGDGIVHFSLGGGITIIP